MSKNKPKISFTDLETFFFEENVPKHKKGKKDYERLKTLNRDRKWQ